nr:hypothetical protein [Bradyrhizobium sp. Leo170]
MLLDELGDRLRLAAGDLLDHVVRFGHLPVVMHLGDRIEGLFKMKDGSVVEAEAFLDLVAYQQVVDNNEPRQQ